MFRSTRQLSNSINNNNNDDKIPTAPKPVKRVSVRTIQYWKKKKRPITMMTAYSFTTGVHADLAGVDVVLVGDSVGYVCMYVMYRCIYICVCVCVCVCACACVCV